LEFTDYKEEVNKKIFLACINKKKEMKSTALSQTEVKGSTNTRKVLASVGLRLRQHCQLLALEVFVKK